MTTRPRRVLGDRARDNGTERGEPAKMDISEILTFVAFGVAVLCVIAWRRGY